MSKDSTATKKDTTVRGSCKRLRDAYTQIDTTKAYPVAEAIKLLVGNSKTKFDATAEAHFVLGIDPRHADQQVRTTTSLPHGTGKSVRVAVVCEDDKVKAAKTAGAVEAGDEEFIDKISKGELDFDVLIATPAMMAKLGKVARVLGPKGLMPSPKSGTVTPDVEKTVKELVAGRIELRNEKRGIIHTVFGKVSFGDKKLEENLSALIQAIKDAKPTASKGTYIKSVTINSTMGAGIKVETE